MCFIEKKREKEEKSEPTSQKEFDKISRDNNLIFNIWYSGRKGSLTIPSDLIL